MASTNTNFIIISYVYKYILTPTHELQAYEYMKLKLKW